MTTSSSNGSSALTTAPVVAHSPSNTHGGDPKTTLTDSEVEALVRAYTMIHGVVSGMTTDGVRIPANFLTSSDVLGQLLGCAHRVSKSVIAANAKKERETYIAALDTYITAKCATRAKALAAYNNLPSDIKAEMSAPADVVTIWVEDFLPTFGAKYDVQRATRTLHTLGYMVHVEKVDGRSKGKVAQPPYVSVTVGKPFRTATSTDK